MRPLNFILHAGLLVLASRASAQEVVYPPADSRPIAAVQVTSPTSGRRISLEEAKSIAGAYAMSNGWYMKIHAASRFIEATIDNEKTIRLQPVSSNKFVSGDGNVTMAFDPDNSGAELTMTYIPGPNLARVELGSAPLAQR